MRRAAALFLILTAGVMAFQAALVLGAPWGALTQGGRYPGVLPAEGRALAAVSVLLLALMGRSVAERAGLVPARLPRWSILVVVAYLAVAVVLHVLTPSAAERALWLPVILVQLACAVRVTRG